MEGFSLFVLLITILIIVAVGYTTLYNTKILHVNKNQIFSFRESLDLSGLPIITLHQGKNKYNFLLDTGSNVSYLNSAVILEYTPIEGNDTVMGVEGNSKGCTLGNVKLYYKDAEYDHTFRITDMNNAFAQVKTSTGITMHGIIGNDFMEKYKYCIDFKEYLVYRRS